MTTTRPRHHLLLALLILVALFIAIYHLDAESLWYDEGWSVWTVYDDVRPPTSIGETISYVRGSITGALSIVIELDVHPPLYYLLLDGWTLAFGEGVFMVRLLSALLALPALAATYTLGKLLFEHKTGLLAVVILGTAGFFIYYAREARMYSLLMSLSVVCMWAFVIWLRRPTRLRTVGYGLSMALLLYTHYVGGLLIATQILYLAGVVVWRRFGQSTAPNVKWYRLLIPYLLALILFAPWIPAFINQIRWHPAGPLAVALPTDGNTLAALWHILTSAHWGWFILPFVLGGAVFALKQSRIKASVILLAVWLLLTPIVIFALNATLAPLYQVRYLIGCVPAGALLVAYGVRHIGDIESIKQRLGTSERTIRFIIVVMWVGWLAYTQLALYQDLWPLKPRWDEAIARVVEMRQPLEPMVTLINDNSVEAYYNRIYHLNRGITIDLSWRDHTPEAVRDIVSVLDDADSVWVALPVNIAKSWDVLSTLTVGREIGYRDTVMNMIFYRFDRTDSDSTIDWQFRFRDLILYEGGIGHQMYARTGEPFCIDLSFTALAAFGEEYSLGVYLTQGFNTVRAQWDGGIGARQMGEDFTISPCIDIPADAPRGPYHLRMAIYEWRSAGRLFISEGSDGDTMDWWHELVIGVVAVDNPPADE